jgi:hypothetical protein
MKTVKNSKGVHNRPARGPWYEYYDKDERKARRKMIKAIRHKLLFNIPLTDEESVYQKKFGVDVNTKMDYQGRVKYSDKTDKWTEEDGKIYYHHDLTREKMRKK